MHTTDATQPFRDWTFLEAPRRWERRMAVRLEEHSAKLPSNTFLVASVVAMGVAITLQLSGKTPESLFIGLWAVPYLLLGVCNKFVKGVQLIRPGGQFPERGYSGSERRQPPGR